MLLIIKFCMVVKEDLVWLVNYDLLDMVALFEYEAHKTGSYFSKSWKWR
jgi:hypothetical protein